ncbi:MAG: TonB-dependent receptor [Labilithrix sp.]|nr:TonB-dependent receptor [Labilithrix sp.]
MTRCLRILLCATALAVPLPALAQQPSNSLAPESPSTEPKTKEQLEAQQHFQRAKELYAAGSYREAIAELELARGLDPKAKDLVFNLGIVHEKLGKFDEAIAYFRQYMEMDTVGAAERAKAENIIKRIEGAKREVPVAPVPSGSSAAEPPPPPPEETGNGRIDAATVTAGSVAIVGLGVGAAFGILALSNRPSSFVTGRDGTFDKLQSKNDDAHTQAIVADVGFGIGIAAALVTAYLYFGRSKNPQEPKRAAFVPSASPVPSGGVLMLGGSFR